MEIIYERVAGLDVHKEMIVACVRLTEKGKVKRECRTFGTTTAALLELLAWLRESGCTHVAMEATGGLLEAGVEHPERGRLRADRGQRRPHQERARPQDR